MEILFQRELEKILVEELDVCKPSEQPILLTLAERMKKICDANMHYQPGLQYNQGRHERYVTLLRAMAELYEQLYQIKYDDGVSIKEPDSG